MAVASRNPFELLNDDDSSVTEAAPAPAPIVEAPRPTNTNNNRARNAGGPASRGGKYYARGGKPSAPKVDQDGFVESGNPNAGGLGEERTERPAGRGGRGGRGGARGGRGRGGDRPERGRPYDKHSQTAHVDTNKTVEQGWGAETGTAELQAESWGLADAAAEVKEGETAPAPVEGAEAATKEAEKKPVKEVEEEDNTITLEEYLAQQKKATSDAVPKLEGGRQVDVAGEEWKDAVQLTKDESEDVYFAGKTKAPPKARAKKEEKVVIEIDGRFAPPSGDRGRGGRGRGEGRGRGGDRARGGPRGGARGDRRGGETNGGPRRAQPAVDVDDTSAFPSLGA